VLVLTRRAGEKIMLGDDVVVHVVQIVGNKVRIGIQAPGSLPVYREEVWNARRGQDAAADGEGVSTAESADATPGKPGAVTPAD
jgi:carbon storage regulator